MPRMHYHVDLDEMRRLWVAGESATSIAARFNVSKTTIWRLSVEYGMPSRPLPQSVEAEAAPSPEDESASSESLAFSPWVAARIKELRLGMPSAV